LKNILFKYREFILKNKFFEAHEILEEEWHKIRKSDNNLKWALKGLINAAVSLELKKRNKKGYYRVWKTFEKYSTFYELNEDIKFTAEFVKRFKP
jgi:predicted metal-dependent hydrolase